MPTKMRLQRHGMKGKPFYHIVIADGRAPRDGRFIEKIGTYNPIPNPAEINLKFDKALDWLQKGAQPTDTVRAILSYKGVLYKNHLLKGVKKGAFTEAEAEAKFQNWLKDKEAKIEANRQGIAEKKRTNRKEALEAEAKVNEARAAEIAKKRMEEEEAKAKAAADAAAEAAAEQQAEAAEETGEETQEAEEQVDDKKDEETAE
jgi:small subunit ribosomal protein S16